MNVTRETADISKYLDFLLYDKVWYKDNTGTSLFDPDRWLVVSHWISRLMCYHVLTPSGTVIYHYTLKQVTNIEKNTAEAKDTLISLMLQFTQPSNYKRGHMLAKIPIQRAGPTYWSKMKTSANNFSHFTTMTPYLSLMIKRLN